MLRVGSATVTHHSAVNLAELVHQAVPTTQTVQDSSNTKAICILLGQHTHQEALQLSHVPMADGFVQRHYIAILPGQLQSQRR